MNNASMRKATWNLKILFRILENEYINPVWAKNLGDY